VAFKARLITTNTNSRSADPEKLTSYELGLKTDWERRAVFNAGPSTYDYKNQQFSMPLRCRAASAPGCATTNAPKSRVDGDEFESE